MNQSKGLLVCHTPAEWTPERLKEEALSDRTQLPRISDLGSVINPVHPDKKLADFNITKGRLWQLKWKMEDYLRADYYNPKLHFGYFVGKYVELLGVKHRIFAEAIGLMPAELSQVINLHRKPKDKLAFRLDKHSGGRLPALLWFNVLKKDRYYELFHDDSFFKTEGAFVTQVMDWKK